MEKAKAKRIVFTGGPGGGKTTAADIMRRELGDGIVIVPETATMLFCGGFPRYHDDQSRRASQLAIFHTQKNMELVQNAKYPHRILLCDRGTIDGAAYWPENDGDFFEAMDTSFQHELSRYDACIFFETAAVGDMSIEMGNPARCETNKQAVALDRKLHQLWSQHPNFFHIPHQGSFFAKLQIAIDSLRECLSRIH